MGPNIYIYFVGAYLLPGTHILNCIKYMQLVWQRRGLTLHESTHNGFLQIMHPRTFHFKNPSDAMVASLRILRKWPVSMATIVKNRTIKKCNISVHNQAIFTILVSGHICVRAISIQRGHYLDIPRSINCKNKDPT